MSTSRTATVAGGRTWGEAALTQGGVDCRIDTPGPSPTPRGTLVVTGGGRGIGAATAIAAAREGWAVCVVYRSRADAAEGVVRAIRTAGGRAAAVRADVSDEGQTARAFDAAASLGPVRGLVNAAGVLERQTALAGIDAARLQRVFAVNVFGTILCAREAARRMSTARGGAGGAIVNVSSIAARTGSPHEYVDYAASKGAVDTFTVGAASELAREGVRVVGVRPGLIHTEIHADGGEPGRVDRLAPTVPMGRGGAPDEVAAAIVWLLSEGASYVTGAILDVGGGR